VERAARVLSSESLSGLFQEGLQQPVLAPGTGFLDEGLALGRLITKDVNLHGVVVRVSRYGVGKEKRGGEDLEGGVGEGWYHIGGTIRRD